MGPRRRDPRPGGGGGCGGAVIRRPPARPRARCHRAAGRIVAVPLPARAASLLIVIIASVDGTIAIVYTTEHQWTRGWGVDCAGSAFGTLRSLAAFRGILHTVRRILLDKDFILVLYQVDLLDSTRRTHHHGAHAFTRRCTGKGHGLMRYCKTDGIRVFDTGHKALRPVSCITVVSATTSTYAKNTKCIGCVTYAVSDSLRSNQEHRFASLNTKRRSSVSHASFAIIAMLQTSVDENGANVG